MVCTIGLSARAEAAGMSPVRHSRPAAATSARRMETFTERSWDGFVIAHKARGGRGGAIGDGMSGNLARIAPGIQANRWPGAGATIPDVVA
nr:hypothetical protein GCM10020063_000400 [Dactylosporangium thailandense]